MNIKKYLKISLGIAVLAATQVSCIHDDNWDAPEITCNNKFDAATKTMAEVVAMAKGDTITIPNKPTSEPIIFDGYVVSSDQNGNFYKTISFQDKQENPTMGMQIEINKSMNYADFPVGSHIRIKANGLVVGTDAGVVKIGTRDPSYRIGRIPQTIVSRYMAGVCSGNGLEIANIVPTVVTLSNLAGTTAAKYINTLVTVKDVQFTKVGLELMDKDPAGAYIDTDREIQDKDKRTAIVRTDGFFKAGGYKTPDKSGDITFVVSRYNTNVQNIIRSLSDINFTKDRFTVGGGGTGGGVEAANLFFQGSDFENWSTFLNSLNSFGLTAGSAVQGIGTGRDNSNSLYLNSTPSANIFVFTAKAETAFVPAAPKKITFWVKGKATKSLSINLDTTAGRIFFNLVDLGDNNVTLVPATSNQYTGTIDTKNEWRLVTIDLTGITLKTTGDLFAIKIGSGVKYDVHIDNIKID